MEIKLNLKIYYLENKLLLKICIITFINFFCVVKITKNKKGEIY